MKLKIIKILTFLFILTNIFFLCFNINVGIKEKAKYINVTLETENGNKDLKYPVGTSIKDTNINDQRYSEDFILKEGLVLNENNNIKRILLNNANIEELITLPGIGINIAQKIIEYRDISGGFKSIEDIKNVAGIGDKKYEKIKELIAI